MSMRISKLSDNFSPLCRGILFGIETESVEPQSFEVEIIDAMTEEVIATQQLNKVLNVEINIAPYISTFGEYAPTHTSHSALYEAPTAAYRIRIGNVESEDVVVSINAVSCEVLPAIITSQPLLRRISYGECDELLIMAEYGDVVEATISADNGEMLTLESHITTAPLRLCISTEDFGKDIQTMDIRLTCNGEEFGQLHYDVVVARKGAVRLAWLSESGAIERYTFPISHTSKREVEKSYIRTCNGPQAISGKTAVELSVASRYEPSATVEALAEIVSSPKVWIEGVGGDFMGVEVVTSTIEYNLFNEPSCVGLNLRLPHKEEAIW